MPKKSLVTFLCWRACVGVIVRLLIMLLLTWSTALLFRWAGVSVVIVPFIWRYVVMLQDKSFTSNNVWRSVVSGERIVAIDWWRHSHWLPWRIASAWAIRRVKFNTNNVVIVIIVDPIVRIHFIRHWAWHWWTLEINLPTPARTLSPTELAAMTNTFRLRMFLWISSIAAAAAASLSLARLLTVNFIYFDPKVTPLQALEIYCERERESLVVIRDGSTSWLKPICD